jgi:hypothetical protein
MGNLNQPAPSVLMAMHQRYEATMVEYLAIEAAWNTACKENDDQRHQLERSCQSSCRETDALRLAILHQVPADLREAAVLQFHIANAFDLMAGCEDFPTNEQEALTTAIETLFDFMCCELKHDHEQIGLAFKDEAVRAFFDRRHRTGEMENEHGTDPHIPDLRSRPGLTHRRGAIEQA